MDMLNSHPSKDLRLACCWPCIVNLVSCRNACHGSQISSRGRRDSTYCARSFYSRVLWHVVLLYIICIYIHKYICAYVHVYIHMCARDYTNMHTSPSLRLLEGVTQRWGEGWKRHDVYIYVYIHPYTHPHTHVYVYIYIIHIYTRMYTHAACFFAYIHMYTYRHIHTYFYTHISPCVCMSVCVYLFTYVHVYI